MNRCRSCISVLLFLALTSPGCSEKARTAPAGPRGVATQATSVELQGVPNFAQVSPTLYRGAQPTAEGFAELKKMGIRTVVSLRSSTSDSKLLKGLGMRYVRIKSDADEIGEDEVLAFLKILEDPANHPVFVHCHRGADRTGCAVGAYRIVKQGWDADEALAELPRYRFNSKYQNIVRYLENLDAQDVKRQVAQTEMPKLRVVR